MMPPVPAPAAAAPGVHGGGARPAATDLGRIPTLRRRSGARLAAPVHGHEETGMDPEDAAGRRLAPGGHAADRPGSGHAAAARRGEPAARQSGRHPAGRPDPETVLEFVDASGHQRRAGSSRAAEKADAVVNIPFARLNCATSARKLFNSAIAPPAGCLVSAATPRIPGALFDRLGLRRIRAARLGQQPDGLRPELRRVSRALRHGPIISHRARGNAEQKTVHIIINEKDQYRIYSK